MLAVASKASFDENITEYEYRTHAPFTSSTFNTNDEVRIAIQQQEDLTYPCESFLFVKGNLTTKSKTPDKTVHLISNFAAHAFEEIRYEIGGVVVDRTRNVGITSTLLYLLSVPQSHEKRLLNAGWAGYDVSSNSEDGAFEVCIPLRLLMGYFMDYQRVVVNQKQELILLLASNRVNMLYNTTEGYECTVTISDISWRVPHVKLSESAKLPLLRLLDQDSPIEMPFRSWELHEYPTLPVTERQSWTIKTSSQLEKPRYVILAFQTNRKNKINANAGTFDGCSLKELRLYLNSQYFPYDNFKGHIALFYEHYIKLHSSFMGRSGDPILLLPKYRTNPIYVIDCSRQNDGLKVGPVDVRLEFESASPFTAGTTAYCLIIHDSLVEYAPLTGVVSRVH